MFCRTTAQFLSRVINPFRSVVPAIHRSISLLTLEKIFLYCTHNLKICRRLLCLIFDQWTMIRKTFCATIGKSSSRAIFVARCRWIITLSHVRIPLQSSQKQIEQSTTLSWSLSNKLLPWCMSSPNFRNAHLTFRARQYLSMPDDEDLTEHYFTSLNVPRTRLSRDSNISTRCMLLTFTFVVA